MMQTVPDQFVMPKQSGYTMYIEQVVYVQEPSYCNDG